MESKKELEIQVLMDAKVGFKGLKRVFASENIDDEAADVTDTLKKALAQFNWKKFEQKAQNFHIVSRGQIEHWLARNLTQFAVPEGLDKATAEKARDAEMGLRHGFGNLALIDASSNSSLSDKNAEDKVQFVEKMDNPALKLLWLSFFTTAYREVSPDKSFLTGKYMREITRLWLEYFKTFDFKTAVPKP